MTKTNKEALLKLAAEAKPTIVRCENIDGECTGSADTCNDCGALVRHSVMMSSLLRDVARGIERGNLQDALEAAEAAMAVEGDFGDTSGTRGLVAAIAEAAALI